MSSDTDRFSQVEEHPVDGQCTGSARLYVNTECISDSSHIITSQYYSVIAAIARSPWPKYMPAIPINQPILAHIIAITLLMNLKFEYQLKVCVFIRKTQKCLIELKSLNFVIKDTKHTKEGG